MPRSVPVPFGTMAYQSRSTPWDGQRLINWYPETAPAQADSKTPVVLLPRPGETLAALIAGTARGNILTGEKIYTVYSGVFYRVDPDLTVTNLGIVDGGPNQVSIASSTDQITIVVEPNAWVYTISTGVFVQITDPDFPGSKWVAQINGYFVHVLPGNSGEFFLSNLGDGTQFDSLDFATAELSDDPLLAAVSDHNELWLFGARSIEPWGNIGGSAFPFAPIQSTKIERGTSAPFSIVSVDNTLTWIGDDRIVYRANGYTPTRISTHAIEKTLYDTQDLSDVQGSVHIIDGHTFYMLRKPNYWTLLYDAATTTWHEYQTFGMNYWTEGFPIFAYDQWFVGGDAGNLYKLDLNAATDAGTVIRFEAISPPLHAATANVIMSRLQVDVQSGMGLNDGQGSDPQAMLSWSDDGGRTWSNEHWRSMGKIGEYRRRVTWRRLGKFYQRVFKFAVTDPIRPVVLAAYGDMEITPV